MHHHHHHDHCHDHQAHGDRQHGPAGFAGRHGGHGDGPGTHGEGRHAHGHGHGGGRGGRPGRGGGRGGFGFDDDGGMPRGRKLSSDDLQLLLLALIAERPGHGYELIKELEARSNGFYVPSPGMMYPALACMEDQGHVTIEQEGNRKRYAPSDEGRAHLEANRERADAMLAKLQQAADKMARMRSALSGEEGAGDPAGEGRRGGWVSEFHDARHALKHALHACGDAGEDEQRRIAAILARAAAEIDGQAGAGQQQA
ncbi:PadR family transcriptional regulator [Massilia forsythiae]|uniref:PadR family transcriptional regulator n=1 Tax=Massilia forsythiae TaxID=2728020 RepID=A0A7Z2VY00_9BURK|nr:PadR family transcriptional regulator [Massilia forsythiae]QJE01294.1 PadR family transcriptional regulator [Massilia forsythiae]